MKIQYNFNRTIYFFSIYYSKGNSSIALIISDTFCRNVKILIFKILTLMLSFTAFECCRSCFCVFSNIIQHDLKRLHKVPKLKR